MNIFFNLCSTGSEFFLEKNHSAAFIFFKFKVHVFLIKFKVDASPQNKHAQNFESPYNQKRNYWSLNVIIMDRN